MLFRSPNVLFRRGFTKESLLPGTEVQVDGYQAKDGSRRANGRDLTFADGKKLYFGPPAGTGDGGTTPAVDLPKGDK